MSLSDVAVLRKAANYMKAHGYVKDYLEKDGRVCLLGAINIALTGDAFSFPARSDKLLECVATYLCRQNRKPLGSIDAVGWNNEFRRRKAEVIAALRGTASSLAARAR
jgi:hypothetical protein